MKLVPPKLVIVTGGLGFIGTNLVQALDCANNDIWVIDKGGIGANFGDRLPRVARHINAVEDSLNILRTIVLDYDEVEIYHLAAESHVDRSITDPIKFMQTNVAASMTILELTRLHPKVKTLMVSTDEVYGDEGPFPTPWSMNMPTSSPYSASKAASDLMAYSYMRTYGLDIKISRCCNNFGPWQHQEKFIPTIIRSIMQNLHIPVYGDGQQFRQWVPAETHAKRLIQMMDSDEKFMHVGGYSLSNMDLISKISKIIETKTGKIAKIQHVQDRLGHDRKYELLDEKAIDEKAFDESLQTYVHQEIERYSNV